MLTSLVGVLRFESSLLPNCFILMLYPRMQQGTGQFLSPCHPHGRLWGYLGMSQQVQHLWLTSLLKKVLGCVQAFSALAPFLVFILSLSTKVAYAMLLNLLLEFERHCSHFPYKAY